LASHYNKRNKRGLPQVASEVEDLIIL